MTAPNTVLYVVSTSVKINMLICSSACICPRYKCTTSQPTTATFSSKPQARLQRQSVSGQRYHNTSLTCLFNFELKLYAPKSQPCTYTQYHVRDQQLKILHKGRTKAIARHQGDVLFQEISRICK
eukprot:m.201024 g.201024  ORF g.201024 m.201024 type:complete len:125 (-) comp14966_c0_seq23:1377-1751(-)